MTDSDDTDGLSQSRHAASPQNVLHSGVSDRWEEPELDISVEQMEFPRKTSSAVHTSKLWRKGIFGHRPLTRWQKLWRIAGFTIPLLLVLLVFGQQFWTFGATLWNANHQPTPIVPLCLQAAKWSPSGRNLAIVGFQGQCGLESPRKPVLQIYDGLGRYLLRQVSLNTILSEGAPSLSSSANIDEISLGTLSWLRHGNQIVVTFVLTPRPGITTLTSPTDSKNIVGIMVLNLETATKSSFVRWVEVTNQTENPYPLRGTSILWDMRSGKGMVLPEQEFSPLEADALPIANQYHWTSLDVLTLDSLGTASSLAVGNPAGDAFFQIWQPGALSILPGIHPQYLWTTSVGAVSPDGRYIIAPLTLRALINPPIIAGQRALGSLESQSGTRGTPVYLTARDAGMTAILQTAQQFAHDPSGVILSIAWRSDGHEVACFNQQNTDEQLEILDSVHGNLIKSIPQLSQSNRTERFDGLLNTLQWSPDGKYILLPNGVVVSV